MKRVTACLILSLAALLAASCSQSDRPTILKFKFEPGLQLSYDQTSSSKIRVMEGDSVIRNSTEQVRASVTQSVARVLDDGTAQVEEVAKWTSVSSGTKDSNVADTTPQMRKASIYTAPNGKVVDVVFESNVDSSSAAYLRQFYAQNTVVFPDTPVSVGGSWTQKASVNVDGTQMEAATTYRVAGFSRDSGLDCIQISYDGMLIIPVLPMTGDSTQRRGVDRISVTGMLSFAPDPGFLVSVNEKWNINGDREKTVAGKIVKTKVNADMDMIYALHERKSGQNGSNGH